MPAEAIQSTPNPAAPDTPGPTPVKRDWGESFYPVSLVMTIIACALLPAIALFGYLKYLITGDG
ncbi:MAG TPA: hypothetical protein VFD32_18385 [Dehalococcoidia bacterium]|jgi:hypothetical protein|nr:hypothetical protein [Dehalococcoidia bacterium]